MIDGSILIGATARKAEGGFQSVNPATGELRPAGVRGHHG
jgi:hypothetical protein